ncbi:hypothetical protein ACS0TY_023275 [Phlomoides rotata]
MTTTKKRLKTSTSTFPHVSKKTRFSSLSSSDRNRVQSSSAEIIGGNEDLLTEILLLLPVKSVVRFKAVSKHWHSVISVESFRRRHLLNHFRRRPETQHSFILGVQGRSQFFLCHPTIKKLVRFNLPCTFPLVKILQSRHGLLLLECRYTETEHYYYYVFNPTTKQVRNIHKGNSAVMLSLVFDPSVSEYYKVVAIWKNPSTNVISVSQYGSDTREWKTRDADAAFPDAGLTLAKILSCNCRAYFTRNKHPSFYYSPVKLGNTRYVVESNGHLHCINLSFNQDKPCFDITELIDNKWSESDSYQLKRVLDKQKAEFLGMIREERMEDSMFLVHVPGQIIIFRLRDETCEVLVDYRSDYFYQEGRLQFEFKDVHPFTESFASV